MARSRARAPKGPFQRCFMVDGHRVVPIRAAITRDLVFVVGSRPSPRTARVVSKASVFKTAKDAAAALETQDGFVFVKAKRGEHKLIKSKIVSDGAGSLTAIQPDGTQIARYYGGMRGRAYRTEREAWEDMVDYLESSLAALIKDRDNTQKQILKESKLLSKASSRAARARK